MKKVQIALIKLMNTVDLSALFLKKLKRTAIQTKTGIIHFNLAHTQTNKKVSGTHSLVPYLPLRRLITHRKYFTTQPVSYAVRLARSAKASTQSFGS